MRRTALASLTSLALAVGLALHAQEASCADKALRKLSLEGLVVLHIKEPQGVDRADVRALLKPMLEKLPTDELIALRERTARGMVCVDFEPRPIREKLAEADLVVHGKVREVTFDREALIADILIREISTVDMTVCLDLRQHVPTEPSIAALTYTTAVRWGWLAMVKPGQECVFVLHNKDGVRTCHLPTGVYPLGQDGTICGVVGGWTPMSIDDAWPIIARWYHAAHGAGGASLDLATLYSHLQGDDFGDCANALALLIGEKQAVPVDSLLGAVEKHGNRVQDISDRGDCQNPPLISSFQQFATLAMEALIDSPDPQGIARMVDFYVANIEQHRHGILGTSAFEDLVLKMVVALPGPERAALLERLFTANRMCEDTGEAKQLEPMPNRGKAIYAIKDVPGEDIDGLLDRMMKDPARFGLTRPSDPAFVAAILAERQAKTTEKARP